MTNYAQKVNPLKALEGDVRNALAKELGASGEEIQVDFVLRPRPRKHVLVVLSYPKTCKVKRTRLSGGSIFLNLNTNVERNEGQKINKPKLDEGVIQLGNDFLPKERGEVAALACDSKDRDGVQFSFYPKNVAGFIRSVNQVLSAENQLEPSKFKGLTFDFRQGCSR